MCQSIGCQLGVKKKGSKQLPQGGHTRKKRKETKRVSTSHKNPPKKRKFRCIFPCVGDSSQDLHRLTYLYNNGATSRSGPTTRLLGAPSVFFYSFFYFLRSFLGKGNSIRTIYFFSGSKHFIFLVCGGKRLYAQAKEKSVEPP